MKQSKSCPYSHCTEGTDYLVSHGQTLSLWAPQHYKGLEHLMNQKILKSLVVGV